MNNLDIGTLMEMLSKMDKKDLEAGISKANEILKNDKKDNIIDEINNMKKQ